LETSFGDHKTGSNKTRSGDHGADCRNPPAPTEGHPFPRSPGQESRAYRRPCKRRCARAKSLTYAFVREVLSAIFIGVIVAIGAAVGLLWTGAGIALFVFALVAIDAKPSWKPIFNTARTGGDTDGVFASAWHRKAGTDSKPHGRH
jgi:hypothetical protein